MHPAPDHDPEEDARVRRALLIRDRERVRCLHGLTRRGSYDRAFLEIDPASYDDTDRALLKRLLWHYRRSLPADLRLTQNPADPIVREIEAFERELETTHG